MLTATKIRLAQSVYRTISRCRSILGLKGHVQTKRAGIRWNLDLAEGIDFAIYTMGTFERSTVKVLKKLIHSGDTVLDIGANIGSHTLHLATMVGPKGRVIAFEPTDYAYAKLQKNLELNSQLAKVVIAEQLLLCRTTGKPIRKERYSSWPLETTPNVHPLHRGRMMTSNHANVLSLDEYAKQQSLSRVDLIKIDVDGQELPVLQGAEVTLRRFRPLLVAEMAPYIHEEEHSSFEELIQFLKGMGYRYQEYGISRSSELDAKKFRHQIAVGQSLNVILIPS